MHNIIFLIGLLYKSQNQSTKSFKRTIIQIVDLGPNVTIIESLG